MSDTHFTPSEHTAAILFYLRNTIGNRSIENALEIGTGSGVIIATLLKAGVKRATGVDVEASAIEATKKLLVQQGLNERAQLFTGNMWDACRHKTFELIVTNLPQFASQLVRDDGHLPTWSAGGSNGRATVDVFLDGLADHLAPGGTAVMTHNVFLDFEQTREILENHGLQAKVVYSASAPLSAAKLASMDSKTRDRFLGRGIHSVGSYWFSDFQLIEICREVEVCLAD
jgi:release factor glutamine methyltransferase